MITTWSPQDEQLFTELLTRWNHHQHLRTGGADVASLMHSRDELDAARQMVRRSA